MLPPSQHAYTVHMQEISFEIIPRDGCSQKQTKMKRSVNYKRIREDASLIFNSKCSTTLFCLPIGNSQSIQRGENATLN